MENEVDTIALIDELIKKGYKVCISYISRNKMVFKPIRSVHFEHEYWKNMRQPTIQSTINGNDIETMVVPLIGFNNSNYRLGYGFNHYNDFLHTYNIHTIGLAYDFQRNDDFVTNRYDKMLKMVITN
jgi:5-formyltetrahydrofolate cyclo-ligase